MVALLKERPPDLADKLRILNERIRDYNERNVLDTAERRLEDFAWRIDIAKRVERERLRGER